ncbi:MAG: hypothetical protein J1F11_00040 [Oscillospiraceae bacterium]|nr:hypothetical protein [Oscillospiraceae bacterium]
MGTWGTGIFQNDTADDVRYDYRAKLKMGKSDEQALQEIIAESADYIYDDDDKYNFWFSLASISHDLGRITDDVKNKALNLLEHCGSDLERWNDPDRKKRIKELNTLKEKLNSEPPPRKNIPVTKPFHCKWKQNDVFYFRLDTNEFADTEYSGKYILILVERLVTHDARIKGLGDILPITLVKLSDKIPSDSSEINNALFLTHYFQHETDKNVIRFMWYNIKFNDLYKKVSYVGSFDFFIPRGEQIAPLTDNSHDHADIGIHPSNFEDEIKFIFDRNNDPEDKHYHKWLIDGMS